MEKYKIYSIVILMPIVFYGCTETYPLITNRYEQALIVEATITNELKNQEIKITKTARFEDEEYLPENGAEVFITDDAGTKYVFNENSGKYISTTAFQVVSEKKYQLHINTKDGKSFESSPETLTSVNPIQSVKAVIEEKDNVDGISIKVSSFDAAHASTYYRYEYEETYKVVAPKWRPTKAVLNPGGFLEYFDNSPDTKICYGSKKNTELLLANTNNLTEDRVEFLARFISDQDYIITTRYSILVRQYIESLNAFNYYSTLKKMSGSGSILSPNQPGFLLGNLRSTKDEEKISGYFDVCSVSTERIYFNYADLFPGKGAPPFYTDCKEFCYADYPLNPDPCTHAPPYTYDLTSEKIKYFNGGSGGFIFWVYAPCADCTTIASNVKPAFWVD